MTGFDRYMVAKKLQQVLMEVGLYTEKIDGKWGPQSRAAYEAFLKENDMGWVMFRPFAFSFIRHAAVTGAAMLAARYGIQVDDATVNGVSNLALNGLDVAVAAVGGMAGSFFSNFGAVKGLLARK